MTLNFSSWILCPSGPTSIGYQYDNLTDVLRVTGTIPAGWSWDLMVQCGTNLNIIPMEQDEDGSLSVTLTAEMIPLTGYYTMQLRATQGELVKYTNQFQAYVGASLSGDAQWPTVPTEFTQVEQNILDLNQHPPYPGDAGYWMTWDLESGAYVQSQLPLPPVAEGPPGKAATIQVGTTTTGEPGTEATAQNVGNENAAILNFTIPAGAAGPTGATPAISVQVSGLPAGSEPTVSVSGTPEAPVISLGIPAGQQGTPGTPGTNGTDGQTPNITIGTVETLPAGSNVTASITGQTPNLVLNLGIPQGPAGAGVPSTEGVPTDYLLSPSGWVAPPSGGGSNELITLADFTIEGDAVASIVIDKDPSGKPFRVRKIYFLILPALFEGGATGNFPVWIKAGGTSSDRRVITTISNPNTIRRGISGFAIGLPGFAVGVMNQVSLNPASMELDDIDGIPYFEVRSHKTDSFLFRPGTVVKVYGQEVVE